MEYGEETLEIHRDALKTGAKVLLVDDLIATGGTALAATALLEKVGADIVACAFIVDLPDLGGCARLEEAGHSVVTLCTFEGD